MSNVPRRAVDQARSSAYQVRPAADRAIDTHREVVRLAKVCRAGKDSAKEVAVEERILVVAARRSDAVSAARGRIEGTTGEVANRGELS